MSSKIQNAIIILIGILVCGLVFLYKDNEADRWRANYEASQSEMSQYASQTDSAIISYKQSILLKESELRKALKSDSIQRELVKKYKKLAESVTVITEWQHDTIKVPVPIYVEKDITVPYSDKCIDMNLTFKTGAFSISDMQILNRMDFASGIRKVGFLKYEYGIDVRNTNPCIVTTGVTSYKTVVKPKWYEHPLLYGIAGFAGGFYINHLIH